MTNKMIMVAASRIKSKRTHPSSLPLLLLFLLPLAFVLLHLTSAASPNSEEAPASNQQAQQQALEDTCTFSSDEETQGQQIQQKRKLCESEIRRKQQNETTKKKKKSPGGEPELEKAAAYGQHEEVYLTYSQPDNPGDPKGDAGQSWRYKYFEEQAKGFDLKVLDDSFDERLANVIYTIISTRPVNIDFFDFNSGDPKQDAANMELAAGPQADDLRCGRHLDEMLSLLDEINVKLADKRANASSTLHFDEKHLRLARVLDSYGRYEAGHLSGKTHSIGQWEQCTNTYLLFKGEDASEASGESQQAKVGAGFCWARMNLDKHLNVNLKRRVKNNFEAAGHPLMVGICLPRSCHSKTFAKNRERIQRLVDSQFRLPESLFIEETLDIDSVFCAVDSESQYAKLPLAGKLALSFFLGWLALTVYATSEMGHQLQNDQSKSKLVRSILECLNLRKSWQDLVGEVEDPVERAKLESQQRNRKVELDALNPIKVFGCAFVVIGHSLVLQSAVAQDGLKGFHMIESDPVVLMMVVGTVVVDTFFVITGILMGYVVMNRANRAKVSVPVAVAATASNGITSKTIPKLQVNGRSSSTVGKPVVRQQSQVVMFFTQWIKFAVTRHLRLVPLFFLVFWFKKSVFINYFAGWPLWDAGFNKDTNYGACRLESWTTPFSVMAAFLPLSKQCVPQAWSVANDLFFSMTIPPIMLVMPKRPKLALAMAVVLIVISNGLALKAYHSVDPHMAYELNDLRAHGFSFMFGNIHHLYTFPHFRFCSILIGMMAGYYLYYYGEQADELKEWPRWFKGGATKASWMTIVMIIYGFSNIPGMKYYIAPYHQVIFTNLFTTGRIVWALCNAVLFMRMASDWRRNFLMRMFSGRFWQTLTKLNFAFLLIHMDVLLYIMASGTSLSYFSKQNILVNFGVAYFYCIPLAVFLYVVYENPIDKLIRRHIMPKLFA